MGSSTRKLRRAAGLTGYEYQRDLKRAQAARKRVDARLFEGITVSRGPNSPPPIPPTLTTGEPIDAPVEIKPAFVERLADQTGSGNDLTATAGYEPVLVMPEPPRRRASLLQLIALAGIVGMAMPGGRNRG